jgi:arylformamidase
MSEPIDISVRLRGDMPTWPDSAGFRISQTSATTDGDDANVSMIEMDVHCGTHVEAPLHFIHGGAELETYGLDVFVGPARVMHLPDADAIGPAELSEVPDGVERLLLRTRNSESWANQVPFNHDYVALTLDGARWVADRGIRLIGVDYLSVQLWGDSPETHRILMRAGVAILEGIDLSTAPPGDYRLTCLPLRLAGAEAAPARAILEALP